MTPFRFAAIGGVLIAALAASPSIADVISEWSSAVAPPPPELKAVTVDPSTTALLLLDIMKFGCSARPRCVAAMPVIKQMHDAARAHNMIVWYSLVGTDGKATPDDVMDPAIKPRDGEWYRQGGPDKFLGSTLDPVLKQAGIKTVIICGNSFQGATVGTAPGSGAARLQGHRPGRLLGGRQRLQRAIRRVSARQRRPGRHHQQCHLDAQRHDQILRARVQEPIRDLALWGVGLGEVMPDNDDPPITTIWPITLSRFPTSSPMRSRRDFATIYGSLLDRTYAGRDHGALPRNREAGQKDRRIRQKSLMPASA